LRATKVGGFAGTLASLIIAVMIIAGLGGVEPRAQKSDDLGALNEQALKLFQAGKIAEAINLTKKIIELAEKSVAPDDPIIAQILFNLAALYDAQGSYTEAELLYKRSIAIREKALGVNDRSVADALNNLAAIYQIQARYGEAE